jgi:hypothetical protein
MSTVSTCSSRSHRLIVRIHVSRVVSTHLLPSPMKFPQACMCHSISRLCDHPSESFTSTLDSTHIQFNPSPHGSIQWSTCQVHIQSHHTCPATPHHVLLVRRLRIQGILLSSNITMRGAQKLGRLFAAKSLFFRCRSAR